MRFSVNNQVVLNQKPEGPLEPYIRQSAEFIGNQGYKADSIHRHVLLASCFSHWLKQQGILRDRIQSGHACQYLRYRAKNVKPNLGDSAALDHLLKFLRDEVLIRAEAISTPRLTSAERCTNANENYLREERGLAEATILNYVLFIRLFLENRFGAGSVRLTHLNANDVVEFVQHQAQILHRKRSKLLTSALRSFLRYAVYCGKVTLDLASAVPVVPNWSMPSIWSSPGLVDTSFMSDNAPRGITWPSLRLAENVGFSMMSTSSKYLN